MSFVALDWLSNCYSEQNRSSGRTYGKKTHLWLLLLVFSTFNSYDYKLSVGHVGSNSLRLEETMQITCILYENSKHGLVGHHYYSASISEGSDVGTKF